MSPTRLVGRLAGLLLGLGVLMGVLLPAQASGTPALMRLGSEEGFLVFQPERLTITAGERVRFEVGGLGPHNLIVAGHPEWSHEPLSFGVGESWEQTFDSPGRYAIWCDPHRAAGMTAEIEVLEAGLEP
ncbi:MAG: plastocyanin/azurin family copper-binding protein [Cyanobium sp. LacPavin_0818_WC50_MAG_67_9]|nr:plastocyanin/azurin family copper-binding protein [Cyanobium sp. LacPavin_0818_WC50_MAG_67_9]